jgi:predicted dehydrogenase
VRLRAWRPDNYYEAGPRESWTLDGGGVLVVMGIHQLDMLVWWLGEPVEVSARMNTDVRPSEGEDVLTAWVRFGSGALATITCSVCDPENRFTLELVGERAAVRLHGGGNINVCRWEANSNDASVRRALRAEGRRCVPAQRTDPPPLAVRVFERVSRMRERPWLPPRHWWHAPFFRHYFESLRAGQPAPVPPREARRSLELTTAIYQSALTGEAVRLPLATSSPLYSGAAPTHLRAAGREF